MSASVPPVMRLRVVSLPATASKRKKTLNSRTLSFSPSTSPVSRSVTMSSPGSASRSSARFCAYAYNSAATSCTSLSAPYSGSSAPTIRFDHSKTL